MKKRIIINKEKGKTSGVTIILNMEVMVIEIKHYQFKIRPYLKDIINDLKKSNTWKIQLTVVTNLISSKEHDEQCVKHPKSDNI